MRFKFRAWDKERLEMFPVKMMDWAEWWVSCDPTHNQARPLKYGERNSFNNERTDRHIIMQYTGMKDKHSKEIYEGDLVKVSEEYGGYAYSPHVVDFKDSCFVLRRVNYMSDYSPMFKYDFTKTYEIIGNIYENPELLSND